MTNKFADLVERDHQRYIAYTLTEGVTYKVGRHQVEMTGYGVTWCLAAQHEGKFISFDVNSGDLMSVEAVLSATGPIHYANVWFGTNDVLEAVGTDVANANLAKWRMELKSFRGFHPDESHSLSWNDPVRLNSPDEERVLSVEITNENKITLDYKIVGRIDPSRSLIILGDETMPIITASEIIDPDYLSRIEKHLQKIKPAKSARGWRVVTEKEAHSGIFYDVFPWTACTLRSPHMEVTIYPDPAKELDAGHLDRDGLTYRIEEWRTGAISVVEGVEHIDVVQCDEDLECNFPIMPLLNGYALALQEHFMCSKPVRFRFQHKTFYEDYNDEGGNNVTLPPRKYSLAHIAQR